MKIIIAMMAVVILAGCATEKPKTVSAFGSYMINVKVEGASGTNGTNTFKTLIMMDDGTVMWR